MRWEDELAACVRHYLDYVDERGLEAYFAAASTEHRRLAELLMDGDTLAAYKDVFWKIYTERSRVSARILRTLRRGLREDGDLGCKSGRIMLTVRVNSRPPRMARFLLLMIPKRSREHLIGDLEEEYRTIVLPEYGRFLASFWCWVQTLQALGAYLWPLLKRILGLAAVWRVTRR